MGRDWSDSAFSISPTREDCAPLRITSHRSPAGQQAERNVHEAHGWASFPFSHSTLNLGVRPTQADRESLALAVSNECLKTVRQEWQSVSRSLTCERQASAGPRRVEPSRAQVWRTALHWTGFSAWCTFSALIKSVTQDFTTNTPDRHNSFLLDQALCVRTTRDDSFFPFTPTRICFFIRQQFTFFLSPLPPRINFL